MRHPRKGGTGLQNQFQSARLSRREAGTRRYVSASVHIPSTSKSTMILISAIGFPSSAEGGGNQPLRVGLQMDLINEILWQDGKDLLELFPSHAGIFQGRTVAYCLRLILRMAPGLLWISVVIEFIRR
jgi:hypothetical protein